MDVQQLPPQQAKCFVVLPKNSINISAFQAEITLIAPKNSINLNLKQSQTRIAEKQNQYLYKFDSKQSKVENFSSYESDIIIDTKLFQSKAEHYKF